MSIAASDLLAVYPDTPAEALANLVIARLYQASLYRAARRRRDDILADIALKIPECLAECEVALRPYVACEVEAEDLPRLNADALTALAEDEIAYSRADFGPITGFDGYAYCGLEDARGDEQEYAGYRGRYYLAAAEALRSGTAPAF